MRRPVTEALVGAQEQDNPQPFAHLVDEFVLTVTESLCLLERDHPRTMQSTHLQSSKTAILAHLEALDDMLVRYRATAGR